MNIGVSGSEIRIGSKMTVKAGPGCAAQAEKIARNRKPLQEMGFDSPLIHTVSGASYVMETIHGQDAITFLHSNSPSDCRRLFRRLTGLVGECLIRSNRFGQVDVDVERKIDEVLANAAEVVPHNRLLRVFQIVMARRRAVGDLCVPLHECHGDLTLSNIIIRGQQITLIDSIPVFLECPILDAAKLLQDARHLWTAHTYGGSVDFTRMRMQMAELEKQVLTLPIKREQLEFFSVLNLFRILPYVGKKPELSEYILKEVERYG